MKMLKKYAYLLTVVAAAFGFAACSDSDDYAPGQVAEGPQVFFAQNNQTEFILSSDAEKVQVRVLRADATEACSIPVVMTVADDSYASLFSIPAYVDFAADQKETKLNVDFDLTTLTEGATYELALTLDDPTMTTPYGMSEVKLTVKVPEPYVLLGTGLIRDDIVTARFNVESVEWEVEIYENTKQPGYIFLKNAYTSLYPYNEPGDYVTEDKYFVVNIANPDKVLIPVQGLGMDWGPGTYGEFIVGTAAYGTLKNGVITFPVEGLLIALEIYSGGEWMSYANANGLFRIALPGAVLTDFSVEVEAAGHVADKDGKASPVVNVKAGADVAAVGVQFVAGDVTADYASVVEAIVAEPVLTNVVEGACTVASAEPMEAGQVTAVVVPFDANGVAQTEDAVAVAFYFAGCGAGELPACEIAAILDVYSAIYGEDPLYPDSSTLGCVIYGTDITACKYSFITGLGLNADVSGEDAQGVLDYVCEVLGKTQDQLLSALPGSYMSYINGDGLGIYFDELPAATPCTIFIEGENSYGQKLLIATSGTTAEDAAAAATPAQQVMAGMKLMQFGGVKTIKHAPLR